MMKMTIATKEVASCLCCRWKVNELMNFIFKHHDHDHHHDHHDHDHHHPQMWLSIQLPQTVPTFKSDNEESLKQRNKSRLKFQAIVKRGKSICVPDFSTDQKLFAKPTTFNRCSNQTVSQLVDIGNTASSKYRHNAKNDKNTDKIAQYTDTKQIQICTGTNTDTKGQQFCIL